MYQPFPSHFFPHINYTADHPPLFPPAVREKFLESRILSALKPIIRRANHPRTLIQVAIQIVQSADDGEGVHVFAFGLARWFDSRRSFKKGMELAFLESQGRFDIEDPETIGELAKNLCSWGEQGEMLLDGGGGERIGELMQEWVREK
jgi:hypothetical protein